MIVVIGMPQNKMIGSKWDYEVNLMEQRTLKIIKSFLEC